MSYDTRHVHQLSEGTTLITRSGEKIKVRSTDYELHKTIIEYADGTEADVYAFAPVYFDDRTLSWRIGP